MRGLPERFSLDKDLVKFLGRIAAEEFDPPTTFRVAAIPPIVTANNMWSGQSRTGHRKRTEEYDQWRADAAVLLRNGIGLFKQPIAVGVLGVFRDSDKRIRDVDNLTKPVLDALVYGGVIEDDAREYVTSTRAKHIDLATTLLPPHIVCVWLEKRSKYAYFPPI
jgi:Holliday junction resolvase RusA-like endonuclease